MALYSELALTEWYGGGSWVDATPTNKAAIMAWLNAVFPDGSTYPEKAISSLAKLTGPDPDILFFLTDGAFSGSNNSALKAFKSMIKSRAASGMKVPIVYSFSVVYKMGGGDLQQMVGEANIANGFKRWDKVNGGKHRYISYGALSDPDNL
jgi:hypothetical protein